GSTGRPGWSSALGRTRFDALRCFAARVRVDGNLVGGLPRRLCVWCWERLLLDRRPQLGEHVITERHELLRSVAPSRGARRPRGLRPVFRPARTDRVQLRLHPWCPVVPGWCGAALVSLFPQG